MTGIRFWFWLVLLTCSTGFVRCQEGLAISFDAVVSLGDSLLDDPGNQRSPLLSEHLADRLGAPLTQLAQGGATASGLIASGQHTTAAANFGSDDLAVLWIGGNDFFNNATSVSFGNYSFLDTLEFNVNVAMATMSQADLNMVVLSLPDMATVPGVMTQFPSSTYPRFTEASRRWNQRLANLSTTHGAAFVDVYGLYQELVADPSQYALGNQLPVLGPTYGPKQSCPFCIFADPIHPSSLGQGFATVAAIDVVNAFFDPDGIMPIANLNNSELLALTGFQPSLDLNEDTIVDADDVDLLVAEIVAAGDNPFFDLTLDGRVDGQDLQQWLDDAGGLLLPSGNPFLLGDANLDGVVDGSDFLEWNANKFTSTAAWTAGDFDANGAVDGGDFILWNGNKFQSSDQFAVPEPGVTIWGLLIALSLLRRGPNSSRK